MSDAKEYAIGYVTSKDGTKIGYRYLGTGPGVILVHGGLMASQNFMRLGQLLSQDFTVYIPDRRGRGLSGPYGPDYGLEVEMEDLQALINQTATDKIFGLSAGAVCVLQTAIATPTLKKIVLYEPPVRLSESDPVAWGIRYEAAMAKGNFGKAFFAILKGTGDPSLFTALPDFLIAPFLNTAIKADAKKTTGDNVSLKDLIHTMHYDLILIHESIGMINKSKSINAEILLMGGTKSQQFLKRSLDALEVALPVARRVILKGLGHIAADNDDHPEKVASELITFFQSANI
ncbi:alpha/beta hydrolase [Chitinophaga sp.]|uniref:alpha/beta fold hydrolase n=1 Tax=Chitinophaga sp. TaxID=1869181 RepID=UPI002F945197